MNHELATQEQEHRTWSIVRLFYRALIEFRKQYDSYEAKVLRLARETGIHREVLRLRATELAGLLDFKKLEELRDGCIRELKDLCHDLFRSRNQTDPLDRYISDIFHEISILKEEHYTVKTYAPMYEKDAAKVELDYILDEAHQLFPQKLRQVLYLFGKAQERLEEHLSSFATAPLFIRSLYVHRNGFVKEAYPDGLRAFYRFMYPCGALEGFYQVGMSFYHSGFFPESLEAFQRARREHEDALRAAAEAAERAGDGPGAGGNGLPPPTVEAVRSFMRLLRAKIRRLSRSSASRPSGRAAPKKGRGKSPSAPTPRPVKRGAPAAGGASIPDSAGG